MTRTAAAKQPSELRLSVPSGGAAMPDINGTAQTSRAMPPPGDSQVEQKRAAVHAVTHAANAAAAAGESTDELPPNPPVPREDIETIEVTLPNGTQVVFGPPSGVALQFRVAAICGPEMTNYMAHMVKTAMSIRQVNGKPVLMPANMVDVQRVANLVGEDGLDLLGVALNNYWPPVSFADLQIVKKNLRQ